MKVKEIETRILEIENILSDEDRETKMASGIAMEVFLKKLERANKPLIAERTRLEKLLNFKYARREFIVQFILAMIAVLSLFLNIIFSQYSMNIAQKDMAARNRPYVSVERIEVTQDLGKINARAIVINSGSVPATNVKITLSGTLDGSNFATTSTGPNTFLIMPTSNPYTSYLFYVDKKAIEKHKLNILLSIKYSGITHDYYETNLEYEYNPENPSFDLHNGTAL